VSNESEGGGGKVEEGGRGGVERREGEKNLGGVRVGAVVEVVGGVLGRGRFGGRAGWAGGEMW